MNILNLFPTPVGIFNINRDLTKEELDYLKNVEQGPNEGNTSSIFRKVLEEPQVSEIAKFVKECLNEYFLAVYQPKNEVSLRITQSWTNHSRTGQFHHKHPHPNSLVSGCFYVNADSTLDKIYFYNDGYKQIDIPPKEYNPYNSKSWWVPVKTGDVVLFPSSLVHMVQTVEAKETRISLAFNTFPVGNVGDDDSLTGLYL